MKSYTTKDGTMIYTDGKTVSVEGATAIITVPESEFQKAAQSILPDPREKQFIPYWKEQLVGFFGISLIVMTFLAVVFAIGFLGAAKSYDELRVKYHNQQLEYQALMAQPDTVAASPSPQE